jgi:hypothetical protein
MLEGELSWLSIEPSYSNQPAASNTKEFL